MSHFKIRMVLLTVVALAISAQAEELFQGWIPTTGDSEVLSKNKSIEADAVTLRGGEKKSWILFSTASQQVLGTDRVRIQAAISGKGTIKVGFYAYTSDWSGCGQKFQEITLGQAVRTENLLLDIPADAKLIRPAIEFAPGSDARFAAWSLTVIKDASPVAAATKNVTLLQGWIPTNCDNVVLAKCTSADAEAVTLRGFGSEKWAIFRPVPLNATKDDRAEFHFNVSGKGKINIGFYAYTSGWSSNGSLLREITLTEAAQEQTFLFAIPAGTTLIRPAIEIPADAQARFTVLEPKVVHNANPTPSASAEVNRSSAVFHTGETAELKVSVSLGEEMVRQGQAHIRILNDGVEVQAWDTDLTQGNPFTVRFTRETPGFVLVLCDISKVSGQKDVSGIQLGGAAFDPERITAGAKAPADLIDYWQKEYAKFKAAAPAKIERVKHAENANCTYFRLTANGISDAKIYTTLAIPKGEGPFPMVLSVPPAGNTIFSEDWSAGTILVTISVHPDAAYQNGKYYLDDNKEHDWYYFRNQGTRESVYYYSSLLGVMRMMEYAMNDIPEWDKTHLAAVGRSQGGGFALMVTALNPRIQAVSADVPALCDHSARSVGRCPGWPQLADHPKGKLLGDQAAYFDAANFAGFISCPAVVSIGLLDTMCVPSSISAAFNRLSGQKRLIISPRYGHGWGERDDEFQKAQEALLKAAFQR